MAFNPRALVMLLLTALLLTTTAGAGWSGQFAQTSAPLFLETTRTPPSQVRPDIGQTRTRIVELNTAALNATGPGGRLTLNLFPDVQLSASIDQVLVEGSAGAWIGSIVDQPLGQVFIVTQNGQTMININLPDGLYQVRHAGMDAYRIQQIDPAAFPEEMAPIEIDDAMLDALPPAALHTTQAGDGAFELLDSGIDGISSPNDDGSVIDVLVGYTPQARSAAGGVVAIQNLISLAMIETNQSYANSGITQRLNLVGTVELNYTEVAAMDTDLYRLQGTADGYMDNIHSLRNSYGADLVSLIVESQQYCGIAFHQASLSTNFASYAFSVVSRDCATGYYSFGHELGHNMGARHDWFVDNLTSPASYAHGYVSVAGRWRTIMAYNDDCTARGFNCTRIGYWANPNVLYGGLPMGIAGGSNITCQLYDTNHPACDADDRRLLNETAWTVANFRQRAVSNPTATPSPTATRTAGVPTATTTPRPTWTSTPVPSPTPSPTPVMVGVFPFYDGFESGTLERSKGWDTLVTNQGRVSVVRSGAYAGNYSVTLDDAVSDGIYSIAALILTLDMSGISNAQLSFYWKNITDEAHAEDGVFVSDNYGATWKEIMSFKNGPTTYTQAMIDLGAKAQQLGFSLNNHTQIKFQFYDNYPIPSDGYALDEVRIEATGPQPTPFWQAPHQLFLPGLRK